VSRSKRGAPTRPPLALSAERLALTLLLPVGSEPGPHDVRLLGGGDQVLAQASGQADIRDFVTTLRVEVDLSAVAAGEYRLAVRRDGDDWSFYPASIRMSDIPPRVLYRMTSREWCTSESARSAASKAPNTSRWRP